MEVRCLPGDQVHWDLALRAQGSTLSPLPAAETPATEAREASTLQLGAEVGKSKPVEQHQGAFLRTEVVVQGIFHAILSLLEFTKSH